MERLAQFLALAAELADKFGERAEKHERENTFPYENYADLRQTDYLKLSIPMEYGGVGATLGEIVRAQVRLGEGCASTALVVSMHLAQIGRALDLHSWNASAKERIIKAVLDRGALLNNAATEPATGSPSRGGIPTTRAVLQSNGDWLINGRKTFTTGLPVLDFITVSATIDRGDEKPEVANFLLTKDTPGVSIDPVWNALFMRLSGSHDLVLENCRLPAEAYLGATPKQTPEQIATNAGWQLATAAVYFGVGRAAAKYAVNFARHRQPNSLSGAIAELPHIQEKVGRLETVLMSAEYALFAVADAVDHQKTGNAVMSPSELQGRIGAAKYLATNKAIEAVDLAIRIVGAVGLQMTEPLQRYYRDVRAGLHNPPMDDVSMIQLGKALLTL
jgi:alkylation response protein AidB-like acyl-CoA dehydrogenase